MAMILEQRIKVPLSTDQRNLMGMDINFNVKLGGWMRVVKLSLQCGDISRALSLWSDVFLSPSFLTG